MTRTALQFVELQSDCLELGLFVFDGFLSFLLVLLFLGSLLLSFDSFGL